MAMVASWDFDVLTDGQIRDTSGYERYLALGSGAALTGGRHGLGLACSGGGTLGLTIANNDYAHSVEFHVHAWVKSLDSTPGRRFLTCVGSGSSISQAVLISDDDGHVAAIVSGTLYSSTVSVLDGDWHHIGVGMDTLNGIVTIFVDGQSVHTSSGPTNYGLHNTFHVGVGSDGTGVARAVIDDLRWFNDPVSAEEIETIFMVNPVDKKTLCAYNFDTLVGSTIPDQSGYGRSLTLTSNGVLVGSGHTNSAVQAVADTGEAAAGEDFALGAFDRLNITCWVRIEKTGGAAAPFLRIEDSAGNPKVELVRGSEFTDGGVTGYDYMARTWRTDDDTAGDWLWGLGQPGTFFTSDDVGQWRHVGFDINPTGWNLYMDGQQVMGGTNGNPPDNSIIIQDLEVVRVCGGDGRGVASIDDLRIVRNYLNPTAVNVLKNTPVVPVPTGTTNTTFLGSVQPSRVYLGDTEAKMYLGSTLVYGDES